MRQGPSTYGQRGSFALLKIIVQRTALVQHPKLQEDWFLILLLQSQSPIHDMKRISTVLNVTLKPLMEKEQKKLDLLQQCMKPKGAISTMMSNAKVLSSSLLQAKCAAVFVVTDGKKLDACKRTLDYKRLEEIKLTESRRASKG